MLVSVIIPCYNVSQYIQECIHSVINQTYKSIEIICIDNNSTDTTWNVLLELQKQYPQLILEKELKPGACAARNKGLSIAKGEWIQFLDADDLLLPNKIEHQVGLVQNKNVAFLAGAYKKRKVQGNEIEVILLNKNIFLATFINQCGNTCSNLWNKDALQKNGAWNENLKSSQEADLMMRLALNNSHFLIDRTPLTVIRERESGQISQRNPAEKWKQYIDVRLNFMQELKTKFPPIYAEHKDTYVDFLLVSLITLAQYDKNETLSIYNKSIKPQHGFNISQLRSAFIKLFGFNLFLNLKKI
ncbi:MAG: glycosyltransferase family 2 protein [Bacteroidetes bacterium]|nr:glycosyltransferase family 2 protein [Bacteroidota bacterium]